MNNLALPPPVISLTEKKLVLKQQQSHKSNINNNNMNMNNVVNNNVMSGNDDKNAIIANLMKQQGIPNSNGINIVYLELSSILMTLMGDPNLIAQITNFNENDPSSLLNHPQIMNIMNNPVLQSFINHNKSK